MITACAATDWTALGLHCTSCLLWLVAGADPRHWWQMTAAEQQRTGMPSCTPFPAGAHCAVARLHARGSGGAHLRLQAHASRQARAAATGGQHYLPACCVVPSEPILPPAWHMLLQVVVFCILTRRELPGVGLLPIGDAMPCCWMAAQHAPHAGPCVVAAMKTGVHQLVSWSVSQPLSFFSCSGGRLHSRHHQ